MAGIWTRFFGSSVSTATGYGIGSALGPALRPVTQAVANEAWSAYPFRPLSDAEAAEAVVRGLMAVDEAAAEALLTGTNAERFAILRGLAGQPPGPQQLLELWNRGEIDEGRVDEGLRQSRMRPEWYGAFKQLRNALVPVSDLIRMAVREVFGPLRDDLQLDAEYPAALTGRARELGLSEANARDYWAAHWDLPSRTEGADMWHRGLLSDDEYDNLLRALDYAPTWRGKLREISNAIPTLSDMIRFAVREVYAPKAERDQLGIDLDYPEAFTAQARQHGLTEEHARQYWAAHWRLPSALQGYRMLWRGEINEAQLDGLLKALDYPKPWRDRLASIAHLVPGRVDLRRMLAAGIIDRDEVKRGYQRLGYTADDAETLTRFAEQQAQSGSVTHTKWADRARSSLFTVTKREYLDESIDETGANAALDVVGVPQPERAAIFAAWNKENEIGRRELTVSEIKKAYKEGGMTHDDAISRLVDRGITPDDAELILNPAGPAAA